MDIKRTEEIIKNEIEAGDKIREIRKNMKTYDTKKNRICILVQQSF